MAKILHESDLDSLRRCEICGAVVLALDVKLHERWHEALASQG